MIEGIKQKSIRQIPDFLKYAASHCGRIYSFTAKSRGAELKQCTTAKGYKVVGLYVNGIRFVRLVHHLILEAYNGYCPKGFQCRHLDGDKENNRIGNLCWGTAKQNAADKVKHGKKYNQGEAHSQSKLTNQDVRLIFRNYHDGAYSLGELAINFNVSRSTIHKIVCGKTWGHLWL